LAQVQYCSVYCVSFGLHGAFVSMPKDWGGSKPKRSASYWEACEALTECLSLAIVEVCPEDSSDKIAELVKKMEPKLWKQSNKFGKDPRAQERCSAVKAKNLVEELIEACFGALSAAYYEDAWFDTIDLRPALFILVVQTWANTKVFSRTVLPAIDGYIESGIEKWRAEERNLKVFVDALKAAGVEDTKKPAQLLSKAFDEAHTKAEFGTAEAETPELGMLQDFVKGWMQDFAHRGWDVIENGSGAQTQDEKVLFLTMLFQHLVDQKGACAPPELAAAAPQAPWPYIATLSEAVFAEHEAADADGVPKFKKRKMG